MSAKDWSTLSTMIWFALFFVCLGYEIYAGIDHNSRTPMLTQVVVRYIPWPFTLSFIVWLFIHFAIRYFNPAYRAWLERGTN